MGLRFNLRTLFIATALLAGMIYSGWRFSKWHPTGKIAENSFICQIEEDGQGLLFTITGSNLPIDNVVFEIHDINQPKIVRFSTQQIPIEPCFQKQIRVLRNSGQELAIENHQQGLIVRLPKFLDGQSYTFLLNKNKSYGNMSSIHSGKMEQILGLRDEQGYCDHVLVMYINQSPPTTSNI